jgi:hypothetical protein
VEKRRVALLDVEGAGDVAAALLRQHALRRLNGAFRESERAMVKTGNATLYGSLW